MSLVKRHKANTGEPQSLVRTQPIGNANGNTLYNEAVVLEGHLGVVLSGKFNKSGTSIASSGTDKLILLWNIPTSESDDSPNYGVLRGHKSAVTSLDWLADGEVLVSSSADNTVGFWDAETGKRLRKCLEHKLVVNQVAMSSQTLSASVGDDGSAFLWDPRDKNSVGCVSTEYPLLTTTFDKIGNTLYLAGIDPTIRVHDIRKLGLQLWNCQGQVEAITSLSLNSDDSVLLARSMDGVMKTYSAKEFVPEGISRISPFTYEGAPSGDEYQLIRATFSDNDITIFSGSEDLTVTEWDFSTRKITNKYGGHRGTVIDVDYSANGRLLLSTSTDGSIVVRELHQ